jgi:hypothetical protein
MMKQYIILVPGPASLDVLIRGILFLLLIQCTGRCCLLYKTLDKKVCTQLDRVVFIIH